MWQSRWAPNGVRKRKNSGKICTAWTDIITVDIVTVAVAAAALASTERCSTSLSVYRGVRRCISMHRHKHRSRLHGPGLDNPRWYLTRVLVLALTNHPRPRPQPLQMFRWDNRLCFIRCWEPALSTRGLFASCCYVRSCWACIQRRRAGFSCNTSCNTCNMISLPARARVLKMQQTLKSRPDSAYRQSTRHYTECTLSSCNCQGFLTLTFCWNCQVIEYLCFIKIFRLVFYNANLAPNSNCPLSLDVGFEMNMTWPIQ